jgi:hypothetical protein
MLKKIEREIRFTWKSYYKSDFVKKGKYFEYLLPMKKCGFNIQLGVDYPYDQEQPCGEDEDDSAYEDPASLLYTPLAMMGLATIMKDDKLFQQAYDVMWEGYDQFYQRSFSNVEKNVNVFESIIRVLGGLLAVYEMRLNMEGTDPDTTYTLLEMAQDFADTLKPAIFPGGDDKIDDRPICTGMKLDGTYRHCPDSGWELTPAVIGSNYLEFVKLNQLSRETPFSDLRKPDKYQDWENRAYKILIGIYDGRSPNNLIGGDGVTYRWDPETERYRYYPSGYAGVFGGIDSYLEYVKKGILVTSIPKRREKLQEMWIMLSRGLIKHATAKAYDKEAGRNRIWIQKVKFDDPEDTPLPHYGALEAFFPGTLALRVDGVPIFLQLAHLQLAKALHSSWDAVWNKYGLEPEGYNFCPEADGLEPRNYKSCTGMVLPDVPGNPPREFDHYYLRPEIIESAYYLYHYTRNPRYLDQIAQYFEDIVDYCKVKVEGRGYNMVHNVGPDMRDKPEHRSTIMESYFIAETLKYMYLAFADPDDLPFEFEDVVFNTEAHPLRRVKPQK